MSAQESIAAALREHDCWVSGEGWTYCDTCRVTVRSAEDHLAAVAMDAAREAVEANLRAPSEDWTPFQTRDIGAAFCADSVTDLCAEVLALLTPDRVPDYRAEDFTDEAVEHAQSYEPEGER